MSKYDVKVYIPKDIYIKLEKISNLMNLSISRLLGQIIRDESFKSVLEPLSSFCDTWENAVKNFKKEGLCLQGQENGMSQ